MSSALVRNGVLVLGLGLASAGVWSATPAAPKTLEAAAPAASGPSATGPRLATEGFADVVAKVTPAVVTSKDTGDAPARVLGDLRLAEGGAPVIVVTRIAGRRRVPPPGAIRRHALSPSAHAVELPAREPGAVRAAAAGALLRIS